MNNAIETDKASVNGEEKSTLTITYVLFGSALVFGITAIVGVILAHIQKGKCSDPILKSHYQWLIKTFWFGMLWSIIGYATIIIWVGFIVLFATWVWWIYRVVKGAISMGNHKAMY